MSWLKKHYHWVIVALVLLQQAVSGGFVNALSLFTIPVSESLEISRGLYSLTATARSTFGFLATLVSGGLLLRFGYRKAVVASLAVAAAALGILSTADSFAVCLLGFAVFGFSDAVCILVGPARIVNGWFHRHQGAVFGAVTACTGLGGSVMNLLLSGVIETSGWNSAFALSAVMMAVLGVLLLLLLRNHPRDMGLRPYGEGEAYIKKQEHEDHWIGYTRRQMLRSPAFYLMILGTFLSCLFSYSMFIVIVPHLCDQGLSAQSAATMQSILMLALAAVKVACGFLSDAIGAKKVVLICLLATTADLVLLSFVNAPAAALPVVVLCAISLPLTSMIVPLLSKALFGYQDQAFCLGIFMGMISVANMVSGVIVNSVFDLTGSYIPAFQFGALGSVAIIGLYLLIYRLTARDRKKILAAQEQHS